MGVEADYKQLANRLIACYSKGILERAKKRTKAKKIRITNIDRRVVDSISRGVEHSAVYKDPEALDLALETIDLGKIYEGVDAREKKYKDEKDESTEVHDLGYEDFVALEVLSYFKNDFFKWINKPKCPICHNDGDNVIGTGAKGPPSPNPYEISRIETYRCTSCTQDIEFPRINSLKRLLVTRSGRCGEWANCFQLVLQAVMGTDAKIRQVWNLEDHVWCEYYSKNLERWIHLDPCENAFDEPSLYAKNWGKGMSYCIGIGEDYVIDLSDKYATEKRIPRLSVVSSVKTIDSFISVVNSQLMQRYWQSLPAELDETAKYVKLYDDLLLIRSRELQSLKKQPEPLKTSAPKGRQTGSAEWTKSRGEDGK